VDALGTDQDAVRFGGLGVDEQFEL